MSKEKAITLLSEVLLSLDGKGINKNYIEIITQEEIPIYCENKNTGKSRLMPFKVLYDNHEKFWQQDGNWEYFLTAEGIGKLREKAAAKPGAWENERQKAKAEAGYGSDYQVFADMTASEKVAHLNKDKQKLNDLILNKSKDEKAVTKTVVDTARDAAMINRAALEEAIRLGNSEAKKLTQGLVVSTNEIVKSSTLLLTEDIYNNDLMDTLVKKSNGTIVQHITRVYLNGIAFLEYYNNLVSTSNAIKKLRISFAFKYRKFYHTLLPHIDIDDIVLERVFYGGMRAVSPELLHNWAVGFLVHDIGKAAAVEYHEGEAAYNHNLAIEHVKLGYHSIKDKTNYPMEASLITGYHHEYYGDPSGYGYYRTYLEKYQKANPYLKQDYCIAYDLEPVLDFRVLAYFPAKVLEIIDVYDSITDPNRVYREVLSPEEALTLMREEFIKKHRKLDAVLFDIFKEFIHEKHKKQD